MTDTSKYFTDPADERDAITLAQARVQMACESGLPYPSWDELTEHERTSALLDARNYLHAARNAGLLQSRSDEADELRAHIVELRARVDASLLQTKRELQHAYEDCDRVEHRQGADQLALRHALRIPPGEHLSMARLIRRVRQIVADLDESRRKASAASSRAVHLAGQINQAKQVIGEVRQMYAGLNASRGHDPLDETLSRHARDEEPVTAESERPATNGELVTVLDTMASVAGELHV